MHRGMMARDVVGRAGCTRQIWHEICCNSLKRRAQEGWRSVAMHRPHVSDFSSSKDTCAMLVIGPSLPVVQYLRSFSHSSQPLLCAGSSASESLLQTFPPGPHGAMEQCTCSCALGVGTSGYHPDHQNTHRDIQNLLCYQLSANSYMVKPVDFGRLRSTLQLLMRCWFSVVRLPERRSP